MSALGDRKTIALAITGASGAPYALRLLQCLVKARVRIYVMISQLGQVVMGMESGFKLPGRPGEIQRVLTEHYQAESDQMTVFGREQWTAPVASGSSAPDALVICPCTTGTLAAVAGGMNRSLLERAADVALKEHKKLILVVR